MMNPVDQSYAQFLHEDEKACQRAIVKARRYHEGHQPVALTDRLREFLGMHQPQSGFTGGMFNDRDLSPFVFNIMHLVVEAVAERLIVAGLDTDEPDEDKQADGTSTPLPTPVADWAWTTWLRNRMDAKQDEVHTGAIRDGEYFVIVDWDADLTRVRFTPEQRYIDPEIGGDGLGCQMHYPDDDDSQRPLYATKRWVETTVGADKQRVTNQRRNIYYPDRIEQQYLIGGVWEPYAPTIPWRGIDGQPMGIAVIHFRNVGCSPEAWQAFPLQDALNKALIDLVAAADLTAFRAYFLTGMYPTEDGQQPMEDGSNAMRMAPGTMFGTMNVNAKLQVIDGADLRNMIEVKEALIFDIAIVTATPASRFITTKQIAAEGTLKQQEGPLLAKITKRQALIGNGWEDVFRVARRLENKFGVGGLDEEVEISTRWEAAETRDDVAEAARLTLRQSLGVPESVLWKELGYSPTEIEAMQQIKDAQAQADHARQVALLQAKPAMMAMNGKPMMQGS